MKYKIKFTLVVLLITFCNQIINGQNNTREPQIIDLLKENNFNLEMYELTVCINELFYIIENDTNQFYAFQNRINHAFDKSFSNETKFIHFIEFENFKHEILINDTLKKLYPDSFSKILNLKIDFYPRNIEYLNAFKNYIEYPEQVDDICIITLLYKSDNATLDSIMNDKIAFWRFLSWLEYGFEEFRYYPSINVKSKSIITDRLIFKIKSKNQDSDHEIVRKTFEMINSMLIKY